MSLPLAFKTETHTIPANQAYLLVPKEARQKAALVMGESKNRRVGLVWAGDPKHLKDRTRSVQLTSLDSLKDVRDVTFYSLQMGSAAGQLDQSRIPMINLAPATGDMADTAAQMLQLDLVISVDTAVAHLAGALGVPIWLMLSRDADWRWFSDRDDSPWYPSLRIFRQLTLGDWDEVVERVKASLTTCLAVPASDFLQAKQIGRDPRGYRPI